MFNVNATRGPLLDRKELVSLTWDKACIKSSTFTISFCIASSDAFVCKWSRKMVAIFTRYFAKGVLSKPLPDLGNRLNSCSKSGTSRCCSSGDGSARDGASSLATERTTVYMLELTKNIWTMQVHILTLLLFSMLSDDRSNASSKTIPPHSAIQSLLFQMRVSSPVLKVIQ